ncbi:MAG TPA: DUF362 domain-containing protein, partial [Anaerolineae bacterium]|nr:DUF362 domain-containing protein [Anaerolineae bacterium]
PETVLDDYRNLMHMAGSQQALPKDKETILKINISWQTWYPACSTTPWQLEGVIRTLQEDGYQGLIAAHNRTVVVDAYVGERNNKHKDIVDAYGVRNVHLYEPHVRWVRYEPKAPMLVLDEIYPDGILIPEMLIGRNIIQLPTVKCIHPNTEIVRADGDLVRAGDLVEERLQSGGVPLFDGDGDIRMQTNDLLIGLDGKGTVIRQPTRWFWRTPLNGQNLWRIRTRTGREVLVSATHPFLTPTGWQKAAELRVGDRVAIPRRIRVEGKSQPLPLLDESLGLEKVTLEAIPFRPGRRFSVEDQRDMVQQYLSGRTLEEIARQHDVRWQSVQSVLQCYHIPMRCNKHWIRVPARTSPDFWRWVGYLIAEGWVQPMRTTCRIWWTNGDSEIRKDFLRLTESLFGLRLICRPDSNECYVDSVQLGELLEKLGLPVPLDDANKRVPSLLFRCPDEEIAAFLSAYLDGDGTVGEKDGLHVMTKSERLAKDVQYLLTRLGVVAFRHEHRARATNSDGPRRRYYLLSVYGDDLVALAEWLNLRSEHKQKRLEALVTRRKRGKQPSNWDIIPLDPKQFRQVRQGLELTQVATGKLGSVRNIEGEHTTPTCPIIQYFVKRFREADMAGRFAPGLDQMAFLASEEIAWDHITAVEEVEPDTDYLYDFTMDGPPNFVGNGLFLHNTHVFTTITGAMKNAFGGLLTERRHWTHANIHETLVDLLTIQHEIHTGLFAVMDGTFAGDGPGPRAMRWHEKDIILASADQVAIDAISAKIQGFNPMEIPFIRIAHEMGLGIGDPKEIEVVGYDISAEDWGFVQEDTFASWGQKMIYHGPLKPLEGLLLRSPLVPWSYFASNFYHNVYWYPFVGRPRVQAALGTKWGQLFKNYGDGTVVMPGVEPRTTAIAVAGLTSMMALFTLLLARRRHDRHK